MASSWRRPRRHQARQRDHDRRLGIPRRPERRQKRDGQRHRRRDGTARLSADAADLSDGRRRLVGNYSSAPVETAAAPTLTAPHGFSGAAINRGDIGNVVPQSGLLGLDKYLNPYTANVIDASLNDLNRARQLGINQNARTPHCPTPSAATARPSAMRNQSRLSGRGRPHHRRLRNQGFDTAAGLLQNDQAKNLQGQLANQGADLNVATPTPLRQQANMFNANAANQGEQFGAGLIATQVGYQAGAELLALIGGIGVEHIGLLAVAGVGVGHVQIGALIGELPLQVLRLIVLQRPAAVSKPGCAARRWCGRPRPDRRDWFPHR